MLLRNRHSRCTSGTLGVDKNEFTDDKENTLTNKSPDIVEVKAQICTVDSNSFENSNPSPHSTVHVLEAVDNVMDAAANKLVRKALRFMSLEDTSSPQSTTKSPSPNRHHPSPVQPPPSLFSSLSDYPSIFDKGLDAITGVGKFVEDVAVTLDTVIGQAFEDWGSTPRRSPSSSQSPMTSSYNRRTRASNTTTPGSGRGHKTTKSRRQHIDDTHESTEREYSSSSLFDEWNTWGGEFVTTTLSTPLQSLDNNNSKNDTTTSSSNNNDASLIGMIEKGYFHSSTPIEGRSKAAILHDKNNIMYNNNNNNNNNDISNDGDDGWLLKSAPSSSRVNMNGPGSKKKMNNEEQQWRRRAQILQKELQKLKAQRDEYQRFKDEYERLKSDLQATHSTVDQLSAENCRLRLNSTTLDDTNDAISLSSVDPVAAELIMKQMEALLSEKAALAQENDRLLREKAGLQELLQYTMMQQTEDGLMDDELFMLLDDDCDDIDDESGDDGCHDDDEA